MIFQKKMNKINAHFKTKSRTGKKIRRPQRVRGGLFSAFFYNFNNFRNLVINGLLEPIQNSVEPSQDTQLLIPKVWRDLAKLEKIEFSKKLVFRL